MRQAEPEQDACAPVRSVARPRQGQTLLRTRPEELLDAAGELLVTRGLVEVTIETVAERADVSRRTVERWWPSDEALAVAVLRHEWLALARQIRRGAIRFGL